MFVPMRQSNRMPEPSTRGGGQLGKGTRARHKMFGRCACVCGFRAPYCGFARACYTPLGVLRVVRCWISGVDRVRKASMSGGASPLSDLPSPISSYRVSLDSHSLRVPPGTTAPPAGPGSSGSMSYVILRPSTPRSSSIHIATCNGSLTEAPADIYRCPPGGRGRSDRFRMTTPVARQLYVHDQCGMPSHGPSPSPSQLDTYTPSPTATSSPLLVVHAKLAPAHPHASCMRLPFANVAWCSSSRCDAMQ